MYYLKGCKETVDAPSCLITGQAYAGSAQAHSNYVQKQKPNKGRGIYFLISQSPGPRIKNIIQTFIVGVISERPRLSAGSTVKKNPSQKYLDDCGQQIKIPLKVD